MVLKADRIFHNLYFYCFDKELNTRLLIESALLRRSFGNEEKIMDKIFKEIMFTETCFILLCTKQQLQIIFGFSFL